MFNRSCDRLRNTPSSVHSKPKILDRFGPLKSSGGRGRFACKPRKMSGDFSVAAALPPTQLPTLVNTFPGAPKCRRSNHINYASGDFIKACLLNICLVRNCNFVAAQS